MQMFRPLPFVRCPKNFIGDFTFMGVGAKYGEQSAEYTTVQKLWQRTRRSSSSTVVKGAIEG
jgi:hypothetical protein